MNITFTTVSRRYLVAKKCLHTVLYTVSAAKREPSTQKKRFEAENLYLMNTNEYFEHNWTMFSTL